MDTASGALEDLLVRARESVRALAALDDDAPASSSASASRAKEASRLLRELERAIEYAQRAVAGEAGSESERAIALSRLQPVERTARELRGALRALVRAEGMGVPPGVAQREQLALLLQRQPGGGETGTGAGGGGKRRGGGFGSGSSSSSSSAASVVDAVGESREVTRSLARTRELMSQELRRMGGVVEVIEEDGAALVETHSAHTRIGSALDRADALLRRLKRQEQLDRLSKRLAFCLFLATVAFIVARRIWLPTPAPYLHLARRVASPLLKLPAQWKQTRQQQQEQASPSPTAAAAAAPGEEKGNKEEWLVGRATKEAWHMLTEGLEEISKEMQQQQQQEEAKQAKAMAAAALEREQQQQLHQEPQQEPERPQPSASAPSEESESQEQHMEEEEVEPEVPPAAEMPEQPLSPPPQAAAAAQQEEDEEGETEFEIRVERFQPPPVPQPPTLPPEPEPEQAADAEHNEL